MTHNADSETDLLDCGSGALYGGAMTGYVWTRDRGVDTVHRQGCQHTHMANPAPLSLAADTVDEAQGEVAMAMGWDNWPEDHDVAFELRVAPCAQ